MHKALWNEDGCYHFEEQCPHCDNSIPIVIDDNDFANYEIECPACHKMMMLCTLCRWDQELEEDFDGDYFCDWSEEKGCYRKHLRNFCSRGILSKRRNGNGEQASGKPKAD